MIGLEFFNNIYDTESELTIFDIGAHHGDSVNEFMDLFPQASIYAFEPDPQNYKKIHARFGNSSNIKLFNFAVGKTIGETFLHKNNYDATHSVLPFDAEEINRWADANDFYENERIPVAQTTLDAFCKEMKIETIDVLKIDIQGGELLAFQGANEMLGNQDIGCLFCEVEFRPLYQGQPLFWDISRYLMFCGYHFVNIVCPKSSEMGVLSWADAIYVNNKLWADLETRHSAGKVVG